VPVSRAASGPDTGGLDNSGPETGRLAAIDRLRGLVMVLMALDHTRDFFLGFTPDPTDLATTTPALFATRWITHLCAPAFLLLAGMSARLRLDRAGARALALYLVSRGLMLVALEVTIVSLIWIPLPGLLLLQVIWAIGWSMILLAPLVFLPAPVAGLAGLALMALHPALAALVPPGALRALALSANATIGVGPLEAIVSYPVLPWTGAMLAGYGLGAPVARGGWRPMALGLGLAATLAFVLVRAVGLPGADPVPWPGGEGARPVLAFLDAEKYPPSPAYLLMTLGPALLLLSAFDRLPGGRICRWLETFGRAPLFFYLLHLAALRIAGLAAAALVWGPGALGPPPAPSTPEWPLWAVWLVWAVALAVLYPPVRRYARLRRRRGWIAWL
jgi:uncharacterized membrane protein